MIDGRKSAQCQKLVKCTACYENEPISACGRQTNLTNRHIFLVSRLPVSLSHIGLLSSGVGTSVEFRSLLHSTLFLVRACCGSIVIYQSRKYSLFWHRSLACLPPTKRKYSRSVATFGASRSRCLFSWGSCQ